MHNRTSQVHTRCTDGSSRADTGRYGADKNPSSERYGTELVQADESPVSLSHRGGHGFESRRAHRESPGRWHDGSASAEPSSFQVHTRCTGISRPGAACVSMSRAYSTLIRLQRPWGSRRTPRPDRRRRRWPVAPPPSGVAQLTPPGSKTRTELRKVSFGGDDDDGAVRTVAPSWITQECSTNYSHARLRFAPIGRDQPQVGQVARTRRSPATRWRRCDGPPSGDGRSCRCLRRAGLSSGRRTCVPGPAAR